MKKILLFLFACVVLGAKPIVSVSIPPQAYFVEKIAKDSVSINTLVPQNADEHHFEFEPSTMKELETSEIYFTIGLEFEKVFLDKFKENFANLSIVDMQKDIKLMESNAHKGNKHEHKHERLDMHTWLDPILVKTMAENITRALSEKFPQNSAFYAQNLKEFQKELKELNTQITKEFQGIRHKEFIVYHPSWGYFARRYALEQIPVEIEGKEPKPKDLQNLIKLVKAKNIKVIFVQPGFSENAAKTLATECNAEVISINHLAFEWKNELLKSAKALATSLK